jgi:NAD(P)-dependent dehydrogenase (short-subunit alcohol dehydrogenase family)
LSSKVWFLTGASRGFGRVWTEAALERGDRVAATARDPTTLDDLAGRYPRTLLPIPLDVTSKPEVDAAVRTAHEHFGRLDVVVNNAGYGTFGMVEEVTEAQARAQLETNFFGALWVTKAVLPILRAQRSGHILQVSSIGGVTANPTLGLYHASKWALEGMTQALAAEVHDFGIKVTLVEPAGYATDWRTTSAVHAVPIPAYESVREARARQRAGLPAPGDPAATAGALLRIVDADRPPLRVFFGPFLDAAKAEYAERISGWEEWNPVALSAYRPVHA